MTHFFTTPPPKPIDPKAHEKKPAQQPKKPDVPDTKKTESQDHKTESHAEGKQAGEAANAEKIQGEENAARMSGDAAQRAEDQKSLYKPETKSENFENPAQQFGHKINVNSELAKLMTNAVKEAADHAEASHFKDKLPEQMARKLAEPPSAEAYQKVAQNYFKGPLQGSILQQKIFQKAMMLAQQSATTTNQPVSTLIRDSTEPFKRGEILQLFQMRHQNEKKDVQAILRYELAKIKAMNQQRVQAIRYQTDSQHGGERAGQAAKLEGKNADFAKQQLANKLNFSSTESIFEQVLQKVLAGGKNVPSLPDGVKARYLAKSDWNAFYKNVTQLSSSEVGLSGKLSQLIEGIFRGTFLKTSTGQMTLVSDLSLSLDGEVAENKFAQLTLTDPKLVSMLKNLKPGDVIMQDLMKKLGEEFNFTKLVHLADVILLTEKQQKEILRELKRNKMSESERKLELALKEQRKAKETDDTNFVYAGNLYDKKERYPDRPRLFMWILYGIIGVTAMMVLYMIYRAL